MSSADRPPLEQLLGKAVKSPSHVYTKDGGAVLALSLHCLFVQSGFKNVHAREYTPQMDWNRSPDAWVFQYRREGYVNTFTMSCGLKQATGQAYVHVSEDNGGDNVSFMGLLLHRYIPDTAALRQEHWQGVVNNEEVLTNYFDNYIMQPVLRKAIPSSGGDEAAADDAPPAADDTAADVSKNNPNSNPRRKQISAAGIAVALAFLIIKAKK